MSKLYVYSTLTNSQTYTGWRQAGANDLPVQEWAVTINGGTNLANKHLVTPRGVVTEITAEQEALLQTNMVFQLHVKNGFIKIDKKSVDAEIVAADLEGRDKSSPIVPEDYEDEKDVPTTGEAEKKSKAKK